MCRSRRACAIALARSPAIMGADGLSGEGVGIWLRWTPISSW